MHGEPGSNRSSESPTVPTAAGPFSPLRTTLGLDEHAFSSSVVEKVVTATARFRSFAAATAAVRMADTDISESQVRRLAHEVGAERVAARDRRVIERRRRQPAVRTEVIPPAVVVEVDGGCVRT